MGFNCGIVGMPNVGKSTLFNALTETVSAEAANYPFCTIEPNGRVPVPDGRLIGSVVWPSPPRQFPLFWSLWTLLALCAARRRGRDSATSSSPIFEKSTRW